MSLRERFTAGSRYDSTGEFTLDESKARQKMARFQLASPSEFLMLVVRASVVGRCREIAIHQEPSLLKLVATGPDLDPEAVRGKENFLFESDDETLAYHLLGVAANAVEPQCLCPPLVEMIDGDLHFQAQLKVPLPELKRLARARLAFLPCPLVIDGVYHPVCLLQDEQDLVLSEGPSHYTFIKHGVIVHEESKESPISVNAIARCDALMLDASYAQVVKDAHYHQLMDRLEKTANAALAEQLSRIEPTPEDRKRCLDYLVKELPKPAGEALKTLPLFPLADRGGEISFADITELIGRQGKVFTARRRFNLQLQTPCLLLVEPMVAKALARLLPEKVLQDAENEIKEKELIEARKRAWEASPRPLELPPGEYLCQKVVQGEGWRAAIGFWSGLNSLPRCEILYQGKLLSSAILKDVPPGATAVIDVTEGEVNRSWLALTYKRERQVLGEVQDALRRLWQTQNRIEGEHLTPEVIELLLKDLRSFPVSDVARNTPLFATTSGEKLFSFRELEGMEKVRFGSSLQLSQWAQDSLGDAPILLHSQDSFETLSFVLGESRVVDLTERQKRLAKLDAARSNPQKPTVRRDNYLKKVEFSHGDSQGEIAMYPNKTESQVYLFSQGAEIELVELEAGRVLSFEAALEAPTLTLNEELTAFLRDEAFHTLLSSLTEQIRELAREAFWLTELSFESRFELLKAFPRSREEIATTPIFPTSVDGKLLSLKQLEDELERNGELLIGGMGSEFPGRPVVLDESLILKKIRELLPNVAWGRANEILTRRRRAAAFRSLPVVRRIALSGRYSIRLEVEQGRGEVALAQESDAEAGLLYAYVEGRLVCEKRGVLPKPFVAALEHESLILNETYDDVAIFESVRSLLRQYCDRCMLMAAAHSLTRLRHQAWKYFASDDPSEEAREEFFQATTVRQLDGSSLSLAELRETKILGYVSPNFPSGAKSQAAVLRLTLDEAVLLAELLGRALTLVEGFLSREMERQAALDNLVLSLPPESTLNKYESEDLRASLGMSLNGSLIGFDQEGKPVGVLRASRLPVSGRVWGTLREADKKGEMPRARVSRQQRARLDQWIEEFCLSWVEGLSGRLGSALDRQLALTLLRVSSRELSSKQVTTVSKMAELLWDLPLFPRVDGTLVSGSALAATLSESETPLPFTDARFRAPGEALFFDQKSLERSILSSVLGKSSLHKFEAPPLFDREELAKSAKALIAWGLTPAVVGWTALGKVSDYFTEYVERRDQEAEKARQNDKKRDPREILLVQLREDVRSLVGRRHYRESNRLFQNLDFGNWPLGPPIYAPRNADHYRLNARHSAVRWLLAREGSQAQRRCVRMLLLIHWVGLVNQRSQELTDSHEKAFLTQLAERMAQTFATSQAQEPEGEDDQAPQTQAG